MSNSTAQNKSVNELVREGALRPVLLQEYIDAAMKHAVCQWDTDTWVAEVRVLPGCLSDGETREEALTNVRESIESWVIGSIRHGLPVPPIDDVVLVHVVEPADDEEA